MSGKQLARLGLVFLALVLLWGAAALTRRASGATGSHDSLKLPAVARNAVDSVTLVRASDTTVLAKVDSSHWTANGHPASMSAVGELLDALADSTSSSDVVAEQRSSQASLGVDGDSGTHAVVRAKGKTVIDVIAGKRAADFSGGYLRLPGQDRTWEVQGRLVEALIRPADSWRDHRIATVPDDSVAAVEVTRGNRRYTLRREAAGWTVSPGGAVDSGAVTQLLEAYRTIEAEGFATPAQADSAKFSPPDRRARVLRKDGTPIVALAFDSTATGDWVKADTGRTIYRMDVYSVERLTPADTALKKHGPAPVRIIPDRTKPAGH
ncbi:MAG: DUF4340 domain-containing protein [Gemmatimonadales bacterium]